MSFIAQLIPVVTGAVAASSTAGMLMIGSAAVGAVGAITDNKTLKKIGALVGISTGLASATGLIGTKAASTGATFGTKAAEALKSGDVARSLKAADAVTGSVAGAGSGAVVTPASGTLGAMPMEPLPDIAAKANADSGGIISMMKNPYFAGSAAQVIGSGLAGAATAESEKKKLALEREKFEQEKLLAEQRRANYNNIDQVQLGLRPIITANLYPNRSGYPYGYRAPVIPGA